MKKVCSILLMFLFILSVEAATSLKTYNESVNVVKTYIDNFENSSRYIVLTNDFLNIPFLFKNGKAKVDESGNFNGNGGLLNEEEYNIGKEYLFNGLNFWLADKKIVNNDKNIVSGNDSIESGIRVTEFVKPATRVIGEGTRINPWEFVKKQYKATISVENGKSAASSILITEGDTDGVTVTGYNGYAFDSVNCDNDQTAKYENGKIKVIKISNDTLCKVKFVNPSRTISYKEQEQTYEVKYSGYYEINAYGAQGEGSISGKGGHTSGIIYLEKDLNVKVITGGQNGYNGGGSGYYNGGGYTSVVYNGQEIMIAAGGGGGGSGTAGGNGDSKGGTSSGGSGKYNGGGASGSDGQNGYGGGGSGYNYTYATTYNDCKYGHNTCTGGTIKTNCSSCYRTECVGGYEQTDCDNCSSTKTVCVGGYDEKCKTCIKETKTCGANQHFGYTASNSNVCYYNDLNVRGSCECKNGLTYGSCTDVGCYGESGYERDRTLDSYAGYKSYSEACKNIKNGKITVTGVCYFSANWLGFDPIVTKSEITSCTECGTEQVYNSCKSTKQECVSSCKETYNSCLTKRCVSDCDTVYNSCAYGENTCQGGWNYATKYYNSGHGGSNLLNKDLINPKSENGTRSGNGFVTISYYGEKI